MLRAQEFRPHTPATLPYLSQVGSDAAALADFRILGPLEVTSDGRRLDIGGTKMRELLAVLLLQVNDFVPASRLADALWRGDPPPSAAVTKLTGTRQ